MRLNYLGRSCTGPLLRGYLHIWAKTASAAPCPYIWCNDTSLSSLQAYISCALKATVQSPLVPLVVLCQGSDPSFPTPALLNSDEALLSSAITAMVRDIVTESISIRFAVIRHLLCIGQLLDQGSLISIC